MPHIIRDCIEIKSIQNSYASHRFLGYRMDSCYDQCHMIAIYQKQFFKVASTTVNGSMHTIIKPCSSKP
jgi:hypothetical protein